MYRRLARMKGEEGELRKIGICGVGKRRKKKRMM
jgi:hypothetical protein